jgi:hypothetical protein
MVPRAPCNELRVSNHGTADRISPRYRSDIVTGIAARTFDNGSETPHLPADIPNVNAPLEDDKDEYADAAVQGVESDGMKQFVVHAVVSVMN